MTGPTNFTEANALLAIAEGDLDTAREIIAGMLPGECRRLAEHAYKLGDLLHLVSPTECANYIKNAGYASV